MKWKDLILHHFYDVEDFRIFVLRMVEDYSGNRIVIYKGEERTIEEKVTYE